MEKFGGEEGGTSVVVEHQPNSDTPDLGILANEHITLCEVTYEDLQNFKTLQVLPQDEPENMDVSNISGTVAGHYRPRSTW